MESESIKLRNQIDMLKNEKLSSFDNKEDLAKSINSLIKLFAEASEDMKMDTHDAVLVSEKLDKIIERLDKIEIQNEKIAKGIVALADMVEDINVDGSLLPKQPTFKPSRPPTSINDRPSPSIPPPSQPSSGGIKPLPTYDLPEQKEEKKKPFLNFKM